MATIDFVMVPSGDGVLNAAALAASTSTAELVLGKDRPFTISVMGRARIKFGNAGMAAAAATDFLLPTASSYTFDTGAAFDRIRVFNDGAAAIDVSVLLQTRN